MHRIILGCLQCGVHDDKKIVRKLKRDPKLRELQDVTNIPQLHTEEEILEIGSGCRCYTLNIGKQRTMQSMWRTASPFVSV